MKTKTIEYSKGHYIINIPETATENPLSDSDIVILELANRFERGVMPKIAEEDHTVVKILLEALQTDGAAHKQYYLEKIFRTICEDSYVDEAKKEFEWEDGTPA